MLERVPQAGQAAKIARDVNSLQEISKNRLGMRSLLITKTQSLTRGYSFEEKQLFIGMVWRSGTVHLNLNAYPDIISSVLGKEDPIKAAVLLRMNDFEFPLPSSPSRVILKVLSGEGGRDFAGESWKGCFMTELADFDALCSLRVQGEIPDPLNALKTASDPEGLEEYKLRSDLRQPMDRFVDGLIDTVDDVRRGNKSLAESIYYMDLHVGGIFDSLNAMQTGPQMAEEDQPKIPQLLASAELISDSVRSYMHFYPEEWLTTVIPSFSGERLATGVDDYLSLAVDILFSRERVAGTFKIIAGRMAEKAQTPHGKSYLPVWNEFLNRIFDHPASGFIDELKAPFDAIRAALKTEGQIKEVK
ncbi:MAG: hypothetical protein AABZ57_04125 [Candidatus Margulisiibacteriota bacterium]